MAKILTTYTDQDLRVIQTGRSLTREQYQRMIENQHAIYSQHRARVGGWRWQFQTTSGTLTTANAITANPDLNWYQPKILLERLNSSGQVIFNVSAYGSNYEIDIGFYATGLLLGNVTLTGTATNEWSSQSVAITVSGSLPLDLYFRARATTGTANIYRIIVDEPELTAGSDLP